VTDDPRAPRKRVLERTSPGQPSSRGRRPLASRSACEAAVEGHLTFRSSLRRPHIAYERSVLLSGEQRESDLHKSDAGMKSRKRCAACRLPLTQLATTPIETNNEYGLFWWLETPAEPGLRRRGAGLQLIAVVPETRMVITVTTTPTCGCQPTTSST
jgi:hypothetical protein